MTANQPLARSYGSAEQTVDGSLDVAVRGLECADVLLAVRKAHVTELRQLGRILLFGVGSRRCSSRSAEPAEPAKSSKPSAAKARKRIRRSCASRSISRVGRWSTQIQPVESTQQNKCSVSVWISMRSTQ